MPHALPTPGSPIVLETAIEAAALCLELARTVRTPFRPVADQLIRSAASVPANLAEGFGRAGRDRDHLFRIAYGSAREAEVHLRLLAGAAPLDARRVGRALDLLDQVRAMTWRLLHPRGK